MIKFLMSLLSVALLNVFSLDGDWEYKSSVEDSWHMGYVPGCVHLDLLSGGLIPDPYYGGNEKLVQWVGEKDWTYRRTFTIGDELLKGNHQTLVLDGVDTYAKIYLNGECIQVCDNMFRTWRIDVKDYLKKGENLIEVRFESVFSHDIHKYLSAPFKLQACANNDQSDIWLSPYARKAGYNYGWDWGPRLITTGLWKSVRIESWSDFIMRPSQVKTLDLDLPHKAEMMVDAEIESDIEGKAVITVSTKGKVLARKNVVLHTGKNTESIPFVVKKPKVWWSNGLGEHPLYDFDIKVECDGKHSNRTETTGIRTVEVVREDDEFGRSMKVRLNGVDIFCKGANYIPMDNFPSRLSAEDYDNFIAQAQKANMNMLRIWGGGIYENDEFFNSCDRRGILVWHDVMSACEMPPSDPAFAESVACEVKDNVRRLRNHPSIALWCGNNENEIAFYGWGWNRTIKGEQRESYEKDFINLFRKVIPESINEVDDSRYYHPSSPVTGYNGIGYNMGDAHYWGVWKGAMVEEYLKPENIARFMSEYGFQAYPCLETIKEYIPEYDHYVGSPTMLAHQKAHDDVTGDPNFGDKMMFKYMDAYYKRPSSFEHFIYLSQFQQAEAIKVAIEAHRRAKPYCMGTLFWQINDCWPVASWSSIDYRGRWKALQYYAAKAYSEVLVSPYQKDNGEVSIKVISDRLSNIDATLQMQYITLDGRVLRSEKRKLNIPANGCLDVVSISEPFETNTVLYVRLEEKGRLISDNCWFPESPKVCEYPKVQPIVSVVSIGEDTMTLRLESDSVIRGLHISAHGRDLRPSDDYITIVPGHPCEITIVTTPIEELKFTSLNQVL